MNIHFSTNDRRVQSYELLGLDHAEGGGSNLLAAHLTPIFRTS